MFKREPQLFELADRNACDKGLIGPSAKWSANNYVDVYEAYFQRLRTKPISILEIGLGVTGENWQSKIAHGRNIQGGASLKMWSQYFPKAQIYGIDINDASYLNDERVSTFVVDQGNIEDLLKFVKSMGKIRFDFIIDDGSHRADHQQISLQALFPLLKPDGVYFIEDLNDRGFGERSGGSHSADHVVSTRKLFQSYRDTGEIISPNQFSDTGFFSDINSVLFYSPRMVLRFRDIVIETIRMLLRRSSKGVIRSEFNPSSHKIVAIHKKA